MVLPAAGNVVYQSSRPVRLLYARNLLSYARNLLSYVVAPMSSSPFDGVERAPWRLHAGIFLVIEEDVKKRGAIGEQVRIRTDRLD